MKFSYLQILAAILILLQLCGMFYYPLVGVDSGFYLAVAREIYEGKVFFIEISSSYSPLSIVFFGLPFLFSNMPDPRFCLLINVLIMFGSALLMYRLLERNNAGKDRNIFWSLVFLLSTLLLDGNHILLEPLSVFFQLAALLLYFKFKDGDKARFLLVSGIAISLSFLSKQYGLFILLPILADFFISRKSNIQRLSFLILGGIMPVSIMLLYLMVHGASIGDSVLYVLGKGPVFDHGNGTGLTYDFAYLADALKGFFIYNVYLLAIPVFLYYNRKVIDKSSAVYFPGLVASLSVLIFAAYAHYFQYILPYAILLYARLYTRRQSTDFMIYILHVFSLAYIGYVAVKNFRKKENAYQTQVGDVSNLTKLVPHGSAVYLDGPSQSYYFLAGYQSVDLEKIGYSFPGYFFPSTIAKAMPPDSYLIVSEAQASEYAKVASGWRKTKITLDGKPSEILHKP